MKRLVLFAGYDKHGLVDDYVVFYLKALSSCADIIYVADCKMQENELEKISPFVLKAIATRHEEYDFGSYKRAFFYAKEKGLLQNYDELILCNDSVYGPFFNLCPNAQGGGLCIIENMESLKSDVWGLFKHEANENKGIDEHLQSYFVAMRKQVFLHQEFENFMNLIQKEKSKEDIIKKYEIGLSALFRKLNCTIASYLDSSIKASRQSESNVVGISAFAALKYHFPFLKINLFKPLQFSLKEMNAIFKLIAPYDENYIVNHLERTLSQDEKAHFFNPLSTFDYSFKDKVRLYSEYSQRSGKYHVILTCFDKKIFTLSLRSNRVHNFAFDEMKKLKKFEK